MLTLRSAAPFLLALTLLNAAPALAKTAATPEVMNKIYAAYWEENLQGNPLLATRIGDNRFNDRFGAATSAARDTETRRISEKYLAELAKFDPAPLGAEDRISFDLLRYNLQRSLDALALPTRLVPINQMFGQHLSLGQQASGRASQPFRTVKDYENWLARASAVPTLIDGWIADMRIGMQRGIVLPKALVDRLLTQFETLASEDLDKHVYMMPTKNFPASFDPSDRARLTTAYQTFVREQIVPAHRRMHTFLRDTYRAASRETAGIGAVPGGMEWYAALARTNTTTSKTPDEIHKIGLAEVARIRGLFEKAQVQVGFKGSLNEFLAHLNSAPELRFKTRDEIKAAYEAVRPRVDAVIGNYFSRVPKTPFEIRAIEAFREVAAAPAQYSSGLPDGSRPGIFWFNAYQPETRTNFTTTAIYLHEAIPGHHFESSLAIEHPSLPAFRRHSGVTAYSEGWGLYSEMLGEEMGLYTDPWQYVGRLSAEIWRAVRLVVDTGIHTKGWSREQAIAYFIANVPQGELVATQEVERYIAIPGQALSYKIGEIKIRELRARAEKALGKKFDVRAFHDELLSHGSVPLDVLDAAVNRWIAARQKRAGV